MGKHGSVSSYYAVEDYWYQGPHGQDRRSNYQFESVWHLVRHPLKTINSISTNMPIAWWHWQEKHTRVSKDGDPILQATRFWIIWNEICAEQASLTIRIEDVESRWPEICQSLSIEFKDLGEVHAHKRVVPLEPITWDSIKDPILREQAQKAASEYGYV